MKLTPLHLWRYRWFRSKLTQGLQPPEHIDWSQNGLLTHVTLIRDNMSQFQTKYELWRNWLTLSTLSETHKNGKAGLPCLFATVWSLKLQPSEKEAKSRFRKKENKENTDDDDIIWALNPTSLTGLLGYLCPKLPFLCLSLFGMEFSITCNKRCPQWFRRYPEGDGGNETLNDQWNPERKGGGRIF